MGVSAPKAVLPLGGETFLSRHLDRLAAANVERVFVIGAPWSASELARHVCGTSATVMVSPFVSDHPGSALSVLCGLDAVEHDAPAGGTLVMDADIVYERSLLADVLRASSGRSLLFAVGQTADDTEEVRVYGRPPDVPVLIGKNVPGARMDGLECLGESMGVIYLNSGDRDYTRSLIRRLVESESAGNTPIELEHEDVWQRLFSTGHLGVHTFADSSLFAECDTPADYDAVLADVLPAIRARDSGED